MSSQVRVIRREILEGFTDADQREDLTDATFLAKTLSLIGGIASTGLFFYGLHKSAKDLHLGANMALTGVLGGLFSREWFLISDHIDTLAQSCEENTLPNELKDERRLHDWIFKDTQFNGFLIGADNVDWLKNEANTESDFW